MNVVVVEDHPGIRLALEMSLELEGFQVQTFERGEAALSKLASGQADANVVLLDLCTDGITAREFMDGLNSALGAKRPRVLVLSALDTVDQEARSIGADYCLRKPFEHDVLMSTIRDAATGSGRRLRLLN